jgi:hypothetical protein
MKTFVLTVSRNFPVTHKRKGAATGFEEKILLGQGCPDCVQEYLPRERDGILYPNCLRNQIITPKIHTIRANYPFWEKRIKQVQSGEAILKVCYWRDLRGQYLKGNELIEICQLDASSGIGVQEVFMYIDEVAWVWPEKTGKKHKCVSWEILCKNDGLSLEDFKEWFKHYDLYKPMAVIHFTKFRY